MIVNTYVYIIFQNDLCLIVLVLSVCVWYIYIYIPVRSNHHPLFKYQNPLINIV